MSTTIKRGRPVGATNKSPKGTMPQHQFRCPPTLWKRFEAVIEARGIASDGEAIRALILAECERFEAKNTVV